MLQRLRTDPTVIITETQRGGVFFFSNYNVSDLFLLMRCGTRRCGGGWVGRAEGGLREGVPLAVDFVCVGM